MNGSQLRAVTRDERILTEKLRLLFRASLAAPINLIVACVVALRLWETYPESILVLWLAATALVTALRLVLHWRYVRASPNSTCMTCWAHRFSIGTFVSGLLWGAISLGLPIWGHIDDFVLLTLVTAGMSAGALSTVMAHYPAYLFYVFPLGLPLAVVSIVQSDRSIAANGVLILFYLAIIAVVARSVSRSVNRTFELKIDNEILKESLNRTCIERDTAQREKWSTLAQMSHELRTPLNAVLGFSEAMLQEYFGPLGDARYKNYASHVYDSGKHVLTLIDEILQLSRGESGTLTLNESNLEVRSVVDGCIEMMRPLALKGNLELKAAVANGLPQLHADEAKLRRMLTSLLHNAIKFTPKQGEITVAAGRRPDGGIDFAVRDTGIGMMANDIPLALLPFGRLASPLKHENEGMGVGLPLCKRLAELHGAEFRLESEPGEGTTCTISFPASRSVADKPVSAAAA